jgi:Putative DNA-binding domain
MFTNFTEAELLALIANQVEENIHLDYKGADSLLKTNDKKKEISKDVSAFANSDGGTIIYGIREFDDIPRRHLPEKIDPIDRSNISKEWVEQVINSNIQPKVSGLLITPIQLMGSVNNVAYVVTIPKSNTAHQASDKKYYKRYNFESVAMVDYEIKDIINRQANPVLNLLLTQASTSITDDKIDVITMPLSIMNSSIKMAKDVKLTLEINEPQYCEVVSNYHLHNLSRLNPGVIIYGTMYDVKIYKGLFMQVGTISIKLLNNTTKTSFTSTIYADNMEPIKDNFEIEVVDNIVKYNLK